MKGRDGMMATATTLFEYDDSIRAGGDEPLCGVDEAGRGPLAGPVFAAAVILPPRADLPGLNDSKKLSEKKRNILFDEITAQAVSYHIAEASVEEIERLNILGAAMLAMRRAVDGLSVKPSLVLADGNSLPGTGLPERAIIGGDGISACIAAASVLAKVARDRRMLELAEGYPGYGFEKHKGYGTRLHYEKLGELGPCVAHRESFLRKWRENHERKV